MTIADPMRIGATRPSNATARFAAALPVDRVLELGTLRWEPDRPTHHADQWGAGCRQWVKSDVAEGVDVDVVADAHDLAPFADATFDAVVAVAVWEHLARPWLAAEAVARVLRPGGLVYVDTHQTFPIHGYPDDFYRFSDRALATLFDDAGFDVVEVGYLYPCTITPPAEVTRWNTAAPAWLNVNLFGWKR